MFNPIPHMLQPSQHRRGAFNGTRIMAALALLFSFLAFLMAGVVMLRTGPDEGGLNANFESFRAEAGKIFSEIRDRFAGGDESDDGEDETAAEAASSDAPESAVQEEADDGDGLLEIDRIRERVDEIEDKVLAEDETAGDLLDDLKEDLVGLRDFSKEDGREMLDKIGDSLSSIRKTIAEDSAEAARRLRALSDDLVRRSREQNERLPRDPGAEAAQED